VEELVVWLSQPAADARIRRNRPQAWHGQSADARRKYAVALWDFARQTREQEYSIVKDPVAGAGMPHRRLQLSALSA
jgi:hypothetical protein